MVFVSVGFLLSIRGQVTEITKVDVPMVLLRVGSLLVFLAFFAGFLGSVREVTWNWETKERSIRYALNVKTALFKGVQTFMLAFLVSSGMEELLRPYGFPVMSLEFGIVAAACLVLYSLTVHIWADLHMVLQHVIIGLSIIVIFVNTFFTPPFTTRITIPQADMTYIVAIAVLSDYSLTWIMENSGFGSTVKRLLT